ncbi:MAG: cobalamin B12-binding domain-containing protein [Myxococcota bacterium]
MTVLTKSPSTTHSNEEIRRNSNDRLMESESAQLVRTIEGEIIPRLMLAHGLIQSEAPSENTPCQEPDQEDVSELARLMMLHGLDTARAYIHALRAEGMSLEQLFIELMAPAARQMGQLWHEDRCSFAEVTLGLSQLQRLARELGARFDSEFDFTAGGRVVLLALAPREQHTFGLQMVEECLGRAGWSPTRVEADEVLVERVRCEWTSAIGFTASSDAHLEELQRVIGEVKKASLNPDIIIMVGGSCFNERPQLAYQIGATVALSDARSAVLFLQHALLRD